MTTQRDRLAKAIHETVCDGMAHTDTIGYGEPNGMDEGLADLLLARGVRVVDEDEVVIKRETWDAIVAAVDDAVPAD